MPCLRGLLKHGYLLFPNILYEEGKATYSNILIWRIPKGRGAWQAVVHGVAESDIAEQLSTKQHYVLYMCFGIQILQILFKKLFVNVWNYSSTNLKVIAILILMTLSFIFWNINISFYKNMLNNLEINCENELGVFIKIAWGLCGLLNILFFISAGLINRKKCPGFQMVEFFFFFVAILHGMWDLNSPTRDNIHPLQWMHRIITTGPPEESLDA